MQRICKAILPWLPCITAGIAALAFIFHSIHLARQTDVQQIEYAFQLLQSLKEGNTFSFFLLPKKYPYLSTIPLSVVYGSILVLLVLVGRIPSFSEHDLFAYTLFDAAEIHIVTRFISFGFAIFLLVLLHRTSKKMFPDANPMGAVLLMLSSLMFLVFATSMRLHVVSTCLIFLTFVQSLRLLEDKSLRSLSIAIGFATLSFCVLQNGLFAYIFPVAAYAYDNGRFRVRSWFRWQPIAILGGFVFLATIVGYPFLWRDIFVRHMFGIGLGNEDLAGSPWGVVGFTVLLKTLVGSETFITLFAALTLFQAWRKRIALPASLRIVAIFFIAYILFFGALGWAMPRYFFPLVPFLALLGGPSLFRWKGIGTAFILFLLALHLQFILLGLRPDTYDHARDFILTQTSGVITSDVPHYYLGIPPAKEGFGLRPTMAKEKFVATLPADLPNARPFVSYSELERASVLVLMGYPTNPPSSDWERCASIEMAPKNPSHGFLWAEVDWGYYWIFRARNAGPNVTVFCRS